MQAVREPIAIIVPKATHAPNGPGPDIANESAL
jgi:hypothetical protein